MSTIDEPAYYVRPDAAEAEAARCAERQERLRTQQARWQAQVEAGRRGWWGGEDCPLNKVPEVRDERA
jgi:multidrug resistance efflux pump